MTSKPLAYLLSTALSLSITLAYSPVLQASFSQEEQELADINHINIKKIIDKHIQSNPELLNSSQDKDIVVFLGKTGAGKSTLINYLTNKELIIRNDDGGRTIVLNNTDDPQAMKIGNSGASQTFLPQFINVNNLTFYDLPGFDDTRGTVISLVNACFIKTLIENARSTRLVFVTGQNELTAGRGKLFKELVDTAKNLIPDQAIEDCSLLVVTKTKALRSTQETFVSLRKKTQTDLTKLDSSPLTAWVIGQRATKMSKPLGDNTLDQTERNDILTMIMNINPQRLAHINIAAIYNGEERDKLREIYQSELKDVSEKLYAEKFNDQEIALLNTDGLENKKLYFQNNFLNDVNFTVNQSPLIHLLRPLSVQIYETTWNDRKEILQARVNETANNLDRRIAQQARLEAERLAEEQRLQAIRAEEARLEAERLRQIEIDARRREENLHAIEQQRRLEAERLRQIEIEAKRGEEVARRTAEQLAEDRRLEIVRREETRVATEQVRQREIQAKQNEERLRIAAESRAQHLEQRLKEIEDEQQRALDLQRIEAERVEQARLRVAEDARILEEQQNNEAEQRLEEQYKIYISKWRDRDEHFWRGLDQVERSRNYSKMIEREKDYCKKKAEEWLQEATVQGCATAQYNLGMLYYHGYDAVGYNKAYTKYYNENTPKVIEGIEITFKKDELEAIIWLKKAAVQGHLQAQYMLGNHYARAIRTFNPNNELNFIKAKKWLRKAADQNDFNAQYLLGQLYYEIARSPERAVPGKGSDFLKAMKWYEKAAIQGHIISQYSLGNIYMKQGQNVQPNYLKAREWHEKSAEQGYVDSLKALGDIYANGWGVTRDLTKAQEYYEKADPKPEPKVKVRDSCKAQ